SDHLAERAERLGVVPLKCAVVRLQQVDLLVPVADVRKALGQGDRHHTGLLCAEAPSTQHDTAACFDDRSAAVLSLPEALVDRARAVPAVDAAGAVSHRCVVPGLLHELAGGGGPAGRLLPRALCALEPSAVRDAVVETQEGAI